MLRSVENCRQSVESNFDRNYWPKVLAICRLCLFSAKVFSLYIFCAKRCENALNLSSNMICIILFLIIAIVFDSTYGNYRCITSLLSCNTTLRSVVSIATDHSFYAFVHPLLAIGSASADLRSHSMRVFHWSDSHLCQKLISLIQYSYRSFVWVLVNISIYEFTYQNKDLIHC